MTSRNSARSMHRSSVESEMIKRREREFKHDRVWGDRVAYYKSFEKANNKYEQWTSPRYYKENTNLSTTIREKRDKEDLLKKRKEKLQKLYSEEEASYNIELMVKNRNNYLNPRPRKTDDIPTEILAEINKGLKLEEEDRRRHQAELSLYKHWRQNSHSVRNYERTIRTNDVKLSWLDQQIQKRMEREKEEEECRKMLTQRETRLKQQIEEEATYKKHLQEKNTVLKEQLDDQITELQENQKISDELKQQESENAKLQKQLHEIEEMHDSEEKRRKTREIALYNITQHKMKLKQKARDIEDNLEQEKQLAERVLKLDVTEKLQNLNQKREIQQTLKEFIEFTRDAKNLEKQRQEYLNFIFDSEAKTIYDQQCATWHHEQKTRQLLLNDVLDTIKKQIKEKEDNNKQKYLRVLEEREEVLKNVEKYNNEMEELKQEEMRKNIEYKTIIDKQIKERDVKKKQLKTLRQRELDKELELTQKEEQRLKNEIMNMQRRQGPVRHPRSRIIN